MDQTTQKILTILVYFLLMTKTIKDVSTLRSVIPTLFNIVANPVHGCIVAYFLYIVNMLIITVTACIMPNALIKYFRLHRKIQNDFLHIMFKPNAINLIYIVTYFTLSINQSFIDNRILLYI